MVSITEYEGIERKERNMCQVALTTVIASPVDEVWETVKDFENPGKYLDAVAQCTMEGTGVGAVRTVQIHGGDFGIERMVHLDEENRTIAYAITDSSLPLSGYIAVMHLRDLGEDRCGLEWSSVFEPKDATDQEAVGFVENFYAGGFEGLKGRHEK